MGQRDLKKVETIKKNVIFEATRDDKTFQLIKVRYLKTWDRASPDGWSYHSHCTYSTGFEFRWKNTESKKWGRTQILSEKGKEVRQSEAFRIFFKALKYSENMTFRELPGVEEYKEEQ